MPNQMIALQARAPQTDILGGAIQRGAAMINQMRQQAAAERQAAQAQQSMDIAKAQEERAASEAQVKLALDRVKYHRQLSGAVNSPQTYGLWIEGVRKDSPALATFFETSMPVTAFNPVQFDKMVVDVEQVFNKKYATPVASVGYDKGGAAYNMVAGGLPGVAGAYQMQEFALDPNAAAGAAPSGATPPPYQAPSAPATDEAIDAAAKAIAGGAKITDPAIRDLTPNDLKRAQDKAMKGVLAQPIAFNPAEGMGVADLTVETAPQIIQSAMQNGMIDQKHVEQLRQIVGPENDQALASWMRQNNVRIQPTGEASFRSAVYRPGGEDMLQEAQYRATGRQFVGRDPMQSPSQVPATAGAVTGAQTSASENVKTTTQPKIVAGEERARRIEKLRGEQPRAKAEAEATIRGFDDQINAIDEFLRHPYRGTVIGSIEGRIPEKLMDQDRSDVIAKWNRIVNSKVIQEIIDDRKKIETGASPLGNMSNSDLGIYQKATSNLTRTGNQRTQEVELIKARNKLVEGRNRAAQLYNDTFKEIAPERPELSLRVPSIETQYRAKPPQRTKSGATVSNW